MAFQPGIQTINELAAIQSTNTNIVPADINGFTFNLGALKRIEFELRAIVTTGATGGFRFLAHCTVAPTVYNAEWQIVDETTPTTFQDAQLVEAAFTNASAVATNYILVCRGCIVAAAATVFSLQFAQNNSTANNISINAGATLKLIQF